MDNESTHNPDDSNNEMARNRVPNGTPNQPKDSNPHKEPADKAEEDLVQEDRFEATDN
jgi:hypothetical protein